MYSLLPARPILIAAGRRTGSRCRRGAFLRIYGPLQRVDHRLSLEEFVACALCLVPVERRRQHFRVRVAFLDHAFTGFLQRFQPFVHGGSSHADMSPRRTMSEKPPGPRSAARKTAAPALEEQATRENRICECRTCDRLFS